MNAARAACAAVTLAVTSAASAASAATADTTPTPVYLGAFMNSGLGQMTYWGDFDSYVWSGPAPEAPGSTVVSVDLGGILGSLGYQGFTGVAVSDAGVNSYGTLSPGADIDYLAFENLSSDIGTFFAYDGPNPVHSIESSGLLAYRVKKVDSQSGDQDAWDWTHVSLGELGRMDALLTRPQWIYELPAGRSPILHVSEAGSTEIFQITVFAIVPGPAPLALLLLAGVVARPSRKRR